MKAKAWIQMGCERREVEFEVSREEILKIRAGDTEGFIEGMVWEWVVCRFGWGWSCSEMTNDFSLLEDSEGAGLCVVDEVLNPRTTRSLVPPRNGLTRGKSLELHQA